MNDGRLPTAYLISLDVTEAVIMKSLNLSVAGFEAGGRGFSEYRYTRLHTGATSGCHEGRLRRGLTSFATAPVDRSDIN